MVKETISLFRFLNMKKLALLIFIATLITCNPLIAQDTLPRFSVRNVGNNRIVTGWTNTFESVKQISIQRSYDSLINFKSIFTVVDPSIPENGYVDTKAPNDRMFYRLYIQLDKGVYLFSNSRRPIIDTIVKTVRMQKPDNNNNAPLTPVIPTDSSTPVVSGNPVITPSRPKVEVWVPSKFVFTLRDGYIRISLPEEEDKKYNIKFFTSDDELLFELKEVKERNFKLDKTNFYHSGWFKFELYENGELKEKNKFFLPKEF
jgi:hypothetical protein